MVQNQYRQNRKAWQVKAISNDQNASIKTATAPKQLITLRYV